MKQGWWYAVVLCGASSLYGSEGLQGQEDVIQQLQTKMQRLKEENAQLRQIVRDHGIQISEERADWFETYFQQHGNQEFGDWSKREEEVRESPEARKFLDDYLGGGQKVTQDTGVKK